MIASLNKHVLTSLNCKISKNYLSRVSQNSLFRIDSQRLIFELPDQFKPETSPDLNRQSLCLQDDFNDYIKGLNIRIQKDEEQKDSTLQLENDVRKY